MFVVQQGAPDLEHHHPGIDGAAMQAFFARKRAMREERIAEIVTRAEREGRPSERIVAAIIYDSEQAPFTTNRTQLSEIGVQCPSPDCVELDDAAVPEVLWRTIYGLAYLGIFLTGTDHLDDRTLLRMLCTRILEEQVRDVPPSRDMSEFIDLSACRVEDLTDRVGPWGGDSNGGDREDLDGETSGDTSGDFAADVFCHEPVIGSDDPARFRPKRRMHRDSLLPRPFRGPLS